MSGRRLALNAVLMAALGLALGHLLAVAYTQRDELLSSSTASTPDPAIEHHAAYQALVERQSLAVTGGLVLLAAAWASAGAGAGGVVEAVALLLVGYGALGVAMTGEMAFLGYQRVPWPLLPLGAGDRTSVVLPLYGALSVLMTIAIVRAAAARSADEDGRAQARASRRRKSATATRTVLTREGRRSAQKRSRPEAEYRDGYPEDDANVGSAD